MPVLVIAKGELWLHADDGGTLARQITSAFAREVARPDGTLVYSNGYDVVRWRDGDEYTVARHELVQAVVAG